MERGRAFGMVAAQYDRGRPTYPAAAVEWLLGSEPLIVADLGAGTGKLTEALVAAGHQVIAVEPLDEMRALLVERVPDADARAGTAEETGLDDASVDAVVAGAAFHWFDRSRAFPEIARILRPPGVLGLLGNSFDASAAAWVIRLREILGGGRLGRPGHWPDREELLAYFDEVEERRFPFAHTIDEPRLLDLAVSRSAIAVLDAAGRQEIFDRLSELWATEPELRGREAVPLPYLTIVRRATGVRAGG